MHIAIVIGTARTGRETLKAARAVQRVVHTIEEVTTELVDVADHVKAAVTVPPWGEGGVDDQPTAWKEIVTKSDALILCIPEYNHGYPGELKLLLDSLWDTYAGKPVGLVGVSSGTLGGARVVDHIKPVLIELQLRPLREAVYVNKVSESVADTGTFMNDYHTSAVRKLVDALQKAVLVS